MLNITLAVGETSPAVIRALASALNFLAEQMTGLPAESAALPAAEPAAEPVALPAAEPAAEKPEPRKSKSQTKREAVQRESAETATADQSAAIAEAKKQLAEDGQPAQEVTVEEIRAVARKLNTDELVEQAKAILAKHGVKSVTELGERDNIVRVSALRDFEAVAATLETA